MVLTIKRLRRRNWSFLRPVTPLWRLVLGALLLTALLHLIFGTLFHYRSNPIPVKTGRDGRLLLFNCGRGSRWKRQLELRDPSGVVGSSGADGYLALLPAKSRPVLLQRPQLQTGTCAAAVPPFRVLEERNVPSYASGMLPILQPCAESGTAVPLVLTDAAVPAVFPDGVLPAGSAAEPTVWQVRSFQGIAHLLLISSCGKKELDDASRTALAESNPVPGNYLFYWTGGRSE